MTYGSIFTMPKLLMAVLLLSRAWAYPQNQPDGTATVGNASTTSNDPPGPSLTVIGHAGDGLVPGGPYKCYKTAADFPKNTFPYELIWNTFLPMMKISNSNKELQDLISAITANFYKSDLVDQPLFLAMFLQAGGNLHLPPNSQPNWNFAAYGPLAMQWNPKISPFSDCSGQAKSMCSTDIISKMIQDSVYGEKEQGNSSTSQGHTFYSAGVGNAYIATGADKGFGSTSGPGAVARYFNSGSLPDKSDLTVIKTEKGPVGSKHYVSDIGNWMMGVSANTKQACQARQACGISDATDAPCDGEALALAATASPKPSSSGLPSSRT